MRTFTSYIFIHWYIHHFYYWNKVCAVYVTNIKIFQTQVTLRLIAIPGGVSKCSKKRANFFKKGKKTCSKRWGGWDLGRGKYHPLLWYNDGCWRQWWWIPQPCPRMRVSVRVGNERRRIFTPAALLCDKYTALPSQIYCSCNSQRNVILEQR